MRTVRPLDCLWEPPHFTPGRSHTFTQRKRKRRPQPVLAAISAIGSPSAQETPNAPSVLNVTRIHVQVNRELHFSASFSGCFLPQFTKPSHLRRRKIRVPLRRSSRKSRSPSRSPSLTWISVCAKKKALTHYRLRLYLWSGRLDLNQRPLDPQRCLGSSARTAETAIRRCHSGPCEAHVPKAALSTSCLVVTALDSKSLTKSLTWLPLDT